MKIAFFWTAHFSVNVLEWLLAFENVELAFVVSQEDKYVWRKKELQKTPLKILAEKHGIEVLQPARLKDDVTILNHSKEIDFFVVVAYGKIIPTCILDIPKFWSINLHGSLLPKYRWASPVQESLKNGDSITGLTTMFMSAWMDEWDVLLEEKIIIDNCDTQLEIFKKFEKIGPELLYKTLEWVIDSTIKGKEQNHAMATYCSKIQKNDGYVDFHKMSAQEIYNRFRAYTPWPWIFNYYNWKKIAFESCFVEKSEKKYLPWEVLRIDKNTIGISSIWSQLLIIQDIKLEWKKSMNILSFINGSPDFIWYKF